MLHARLFHDQEPAHKVDGALAADSIAPSVSVENVTCAFAVGYQGNGNTAGTVPSDPKWYLPGSTATVLEGTGLKRGTEVFAGWSTIQFGPVNYSPGASIGPLNGPATLWAVYAAAKTVTFDANGGTGSMASQSSAAPAALEKNAFERTDYAFVDWNTAADGSGTSYANEATYSFAADVTLFAQWREAKEPEPEPVPPLEPGESEVKIDGNVTPVAPEPLPGDNGVIFVDAGWTMTLQGLGADGVPLALNKDGVLVLESERDAQTTGTGFMPNSPVGLFLDPPIETPPTGRRVPRVVDLGTVTVGSDGSFSGIKTMPEEIAPGPHVLQAVGYGPTGDRRVVSLGILVRPWITLKQGTRVPAGRNDRIRTTGDTGGIAPGTRLTPYIKYTGQEKFKKGRATIVVKADGTYRWTRKIRKNRGVTAYVRWTDVRSNTVFWAKIT
ncbi:MAG: InlB B-repeat-containing protein [bacterium]